MPVEIGFIGEHRQAGRAVFGEASGNRGGVEVGAENPGARRGFFHLGDDCRTPGTEVAFDRVDESARRRQPVDGGAQFGQRVGGRAPRDFPRFGRQNFAEDAGGQGWHPATHGRGSFSAGRGRAASGSTRGGTAPLRPPGQRCLSAMISSSSVQAVTSKQSGNDDRSTASE